MPFRYEEHAPALALRKFIACYWVLDASDSLGHHVFPDCCSDFIFDLTSGRAWFVGVMTKPFTTPPSKIAKFVGVRFRPGEAFAFLGIASNELRDGACSLGDALGPAARSFATAAYKAKSSKQLIFQLDSLLMARLSRLHPFDRRVRASVRTLIESSSAPRVNELAREAGVGERQLERLFEERVGIGPKAFARVARMQRALCLFGNSGGVSSWSRVAVEAGYADQAHLTREIVRMTSLTPSAIARAFAMSDSFKQPLGPLAIFAA